MRCVHPFFYAYPVTLNLDNEKKNGIMTKEPTAVAMPKAPKTEQGGDTP